MEKKSMAILQKYVIAVGFFSFWSIYVVVISFHDIFRLTFTEDVKRQIQVENFSK